MKSNARVHKYIQENNKNFETQQLEMTWFKRFCHERGGEMFHESIHTRSRMIRTIKTEAASLVPSVDKAASAYWHENEITVAANSAGTIIAISYIKNQNTGECAMMKVNEELLLSVIARFKLVEEHKQILKIKKQKKTLLSNMGNQANLQALATKHHKDMIVVENPKALIITNRQKTATYTIKKDRVKDRELIKDMKYMNVLMSKVKGLCDINVKNFSLPAKGSFFIST